jgi:hypothetical protein
MKTVLTMLEVLRNIIFQSCIAAFLNDGLNERLNDKLLQIGLELGKARM